MGDSGPRLKYVGYDTGRYGARRAAGLTLRFMDMDTGAPAYVVFNVELDRARSTAGGVAGAPLPKKQFRVSERSKFYSFWLSAGLHIPDRMGNFYKHMGQLKTLVFTAQVDGEKIMKDTLRPYSVDSNPKHKVSTKLAQGRHKDGTTIRHKDLPEAHAITGIQQFPATCDFGHGNTATRNKASRVSLPPSSPPPCPRCSGEGCNWCSPMTETQLQEQAYDEWMSGQMQR